MKRIVAICLCLVISSVCRAQVGYQGQSAISLGVAKTNYGVMADLRFMNQVTPRSAIGGEVVYNREQLSTTDDADFNAQQVLVGVVYQYPVLFGRLGFFPSASCGIESSPQKRSYIFSVARFSGYCSVTLGVKNSRPVTFMPVSSVPSP